MHLKFGNHTHPIGECAFVILRTPVLNEAKQQIAYIERWDLQGMVVASSASTLASKLAALEDAYSQGGRNIELRFPDGTRSPHGLSSRDCLGGTRIAAPLSYPEGQRSELTTYRTFTVSIEGEIPTPGATSRLISFDETLTFTGGGPMTGFLEPLNGPPIKQQLKEQTVYRVTQVGSAVGYLAAPAPRLPLWPAALVMPATQITLSSPQRVGEGRDTVYTNYQVSWSYQFEAAGPLYGQPNRW